LTIAYGAELAVIARNAGAEIDSYGLGAGEFRAEDAQMGASGMRFRLVAPAGELMFKRG
jgi:UDP-N-acetylmuramoyl-L-alanyl-D-glutamate--2,6-diaminopimelate ligase